MTHIPFTAEEPLNTAYSEGHYVTAQVSTRSDHDTRCVCAQHMGRRRCGAGSGCRSRHYPNLLPTLSNRCGTRGTTIHHSELQPRNPSVHQVKVEIRIQAGNLAYSGPASVTVGNGLSASFQVTLRADLRAPEGSQTVAITAEVTQANGVPVTSSPSTYTVLAIIRQFSRLRVESDVAFIRSDPKSTRI